MGPEPLTSTKEACEDGSWNSMTRLISIKSPYINCVLELFFFSSAHPFWSCGGSWWRPRQQWRRWCYSAARPRCPPPRPSASWLHLSNTHKHGISGRCKACSCTHLSLVMSINWKKGHKYWVYRIWFMGWIWNQRWHLAREHVHITCITITDPLLLWAAFCSSDAPPKKEKKINMSAFWCLVLLPEAPAICTVWLSLRQPNVWEYKQNVLFAPWRSDHCKSGPDCDD